MAASGHPALGERCLDGVTPDRPQRRPPGRAPRTSSAASTIQTAASREPGRFTRSSSRAAAQPNASVARRAVADHAVGGVDRLVGGDARQSEHAAPDRRRHHRVGEILRQALHRRAHHASLIEALRIAADNVRDGVAPAFQHRIDRTPRRRHGHGSTGCVARTVCWRAASAAAVQARAAATPGRPPARANVGTTATASSTNNANPPAMRRSQGVSASRLRLRSSHVSTAPSHITGWPIAASNAAGYPMAASISSAPARIARLVAGDIRRVPTCWLNLRAWVA